jgi:site-specific DNA recombinase
MIAKKTISAVGYVRMSSDKQEKSPDQQREVINKLAKREGYRIVRWYEDLRISGDATEKRKDFQRMVRDAGSSRDFQAILCWDYSRFGRFASIEAGRWIDPLRKAGVQLVTATEGLIDWTTFAGRVMNALYSEGKNQFLTDLSKNVIRGKVRSVMAGHVCGSRAPYGYDRVVVDPATNQRTRLKRRQKALKPAGWYTTLDLSDDPQEIETLRWIFEVFIQKRVSLLSIARDLNKRGRRGAEGGVWTTHQIKKLLANPVYCGDLVWNRVRRGKYYCYFKGEICPDAELTSAGVMPGNSRHMPKESWIVKTGAIPPIVTRDVWEKAQARLADRDRTRKQPRAGGHPLSGLVFCGHCGQPMYGVTYRKKGSGGKAKYKYHKYRCRTRQTTGDNRCGSHEVHEEGLLEFVFQMIRNNLLTPDNMDRLEEAVARQLEAGAERDPTQQKRLVKAIADLLDAKIKKGTENLLLAERDEMPAMRRLLQEWRDQRQSLQADLDALETPQLATKAEQPRTIKAALAECERLNEGLESDDPGIVREVLAATVDRIDLWFTKEKTSKRQHRYPFCRGLLTLKTDFLFRTVATTSR